MTTPLSEYSQTSGLDFIQAQGMTVTTMETLRTMNHEFDSIILTANKFIESQNEQLELFEHDLFLIIYFLLYVRYRKKIRMPGDEAPPTDAVAILKRKNYKIPCALAL